MSILEFEVGLRFCRQWLWKVDLVTQFKCLLIYCNLQVRASFLTSAMSCHDVEFSLFFSLQRYILIPYISALACVFPFMLVFFFITKSDPSQYSFFFIINIMSCDFHVWYSFLYTLGGVTWVVLINEFSIKLFKLLS